MTATPGGPTAPPAPLRAWARRGLLHLAGLATPELVAAAAMAVLVVVRQPLNLDVAWYFVAARRWLGGARLYVDVVETNPPLVIWLTSVPAWLGGLLRASDEVALAAFVSAIRTTTMALVGSARTQALVLCGAVGVVMPWRLARHASVVPTPFVGLATLGFTASYVMQTQGSQYHLVPALLFGTLTTCLLWIHVADWMRASTPPPRWASAIVWAAAVVVATYGVGVLAARTAPRALSTLRAGEFAGVRAVADLAATTTLGEPFYVFTTSMQPQFPAVNLARLDWPYRYPCLWPLPTFYPRDPGAPLVYRRPETQDPLERRFFEAVVDDLVAHPPRLLLVERGLRQQAMEGREFDFIAYFSASDRFASLFRRYERIGQLAEFEVFERVR